MKQKLHAVSHNAEDEDQGTPTTCGTVVVFVDGLSSVDEDNIGTLYCYYCVELLNFRGITSSGLQRLTQIASQNLTAIGAPSLTPPTVISEDDSIVAIEVNSQDTANNSLIDGYQLESNPKIGDNFVVATTANLSTNVNPTIRVRSSDGSIIPTNYYKLTTAPNMIKNNQNLNLAALKLFDPLNVNNADLNAGFIDLFYTGLVFVKNVADAVGQAAKVIIEVVKPYVTVATNASVVELVDQFSAITKGSEMEITLPDVATQDFKDDFNLASVLKTSKTSATNVSFIIDEVADSALLKPDKVELVHNDTGGPVTADLLTPGVAVDLNITNLQSFSLNYTFTDTNSLFKIGKTFNIFGVGADVSADGVRLYPLNTPNLTGGLGSQNINFFPRVDGYFISNFSVTTESTSEGFYVFSLNLDLLLSDLRDGSTGHALSATFVFSDITEVDRNFAIAETPSSLRKRKLN